jgi:hypothetical protein
MMAKLAAPRIQQISTMATTAERSSYKQRKMTHIQTELRFVGEIPALAHRPNPLKPAVERRLGPRVCLGFLESS